MSEVELKKLFIGKCNVRRDLGDIGELVESVKQVGVLEPLIVRPVKGRYEVIVGKRRYNAAKRAKLRGVPCIVREMGDDEAMVTSLTENIQRGDIGEEEIAMAYISLHEMNPKRWTQEAFAKRLVKNQSWVSRTLTAYESLIKLKGIVKGMKAHPREEERKKGIAPVEHLREMEYALRSEEVKKTLSEKKIEESRKELAKETLDLPIDDAKAVYDRFKMYPEKHLKEIKEEALARKTGVALETYLPPRLAREVDILAEERKTSIEEVLPEVVEAGLKAKEKREFRESEVSVKGSALKEILTEDVWECPMCHTRCKLIHIEPKGHRLEEAH